MKWSKQCNTCRFKKRIENEKCPESLWRINHDDNGELVIPGVPNCIRYVRNKEKIDESLCSLCQEEGVEARPLVIRYGNLTARMLICVECMNGNSKEISHEIWDKALKRFSDRIEEENR